MSESKHALAVLADAFAAIGYRVSDVEGCIPFPPLALEFRIAHVTLHRAAGTLLVKVLVEAAAEGDPREGVRVGAVGFGPTEAEAMRMAADQWLEGVFPVLHNFAAPHGTELGVFVREMLVVDHETSRRFGWRVHLGPLLLTRYGNVMQPAELLPTQEDILRALFDEISAVAAHETLFWIESFVGRVPNHATEVTCVLRNSVWPPGETALRAWASARPAFEGLGARQFLLFESVPPSQLASAESLSRSLDAELAETQAE